MEFLIGFIGKRGEGRRGRRGRRPSRISKEKKFIKVSRDEFNQNSTFKRCDDRVENSNDLSMRLFTSCVTSEEGKKKKEKEKVINNIKRKTWLIRSRRIKEIEKWMKESIHWGTRRGRFGGERKKKRFINQIYNRKENKYFANAFFSHSPPPLSFSLSLTWHNYLYKIKAYWAPKKLRRDKWKIFSWIFWNRNYGNRLSRRRKNIFFFFILFRHFALFTIKSGIERNKKKKNTKRLESKIEAVNWAKLIGNEDFVILSRFTNHFLR